MIAFSSAITFLRSASVIIAGFTFIFESIVTCAAVPTQSAAIRFMSSSTSRPAVNASTS